MKHLLWGIDQYFSATVTVAADLSIEGAVFRFDLGLDFLQAQIQTVLDAEISRAISDGHLTFTVLISGGALAAALVKEQTHHLNWQLRIRPAGTTAERVFQDSIQVKPSFSDFVPPDAPASFYVTTQDLDKTGYLPGQGLVFDSKGVLRPADIGGSVGVAFAATAPAAIALSALRVVVEEGGEFVYADPSNAGHAQQAAGIVTQAYAQDETATARLSVIVSDNGWSWDPALPIWLGPNGTLTQTVPTTGYSRVVARAIDATSIFFEAQEAIKL